jgi:rubrerythrin
MDKFNSTEEILLFAIEREQEAVNFYTRLSANSKNDEMKRVFEEFAMEEVGHKAKLQKIKDEQIYIFSPENVLDLNISDYVVPDVITPDISYQAALIVAMNREKAAFKLYLKLASLTDIPALKELFMALAQEESKHKLRFEIEYDENVLKEN